MLRPRRVLEAADYAEVIDKSYTWYIEVVEHLSTVVRDAE